MLTDLKVQYQYVKSLLCCTSASFRPLHLATDAKLELDPDQA